MTPDFRRTLVIYAVIVAILVVLAFGLVPGMELVGMGVVLVLILGGISFLFSEVRERRRRRKLAARWQALAGGQAAYGRPRSAAGWPDSRRTRAGAPEGPAVRRVPASRRASDTSQAAAVTPGSAHDTGARRSV